MKFKIRQYEDIREYVKTLSLKELIYIITQPNYRIDDDIHNFSKTAFIHPNAYGKVKNIAAILKKENANILITTDMEAGPGTALKGTPIFPSMRAAKETGDPHLAYLMGVSAAKYAKKAGINWSFSPCVDILLNHQSPITSLRSASEDTDEVITYASQYLMGMQEHGLLGTLKHFPGEGITTYDQHLTTAANSLTKEEWDQTYRRVYTTLIEAGAASIMVAHISLGCYDEIDPLYGMYPPASLSYNLITNLLIQDLGFEGIIISDATEMGGFCGYINYYEACKRFLNAGGDILLFTHPDEEFIKHMQSFIDDHTLSIELLQKKAYKILCFIRMYFETKFKELPDFNSQEIANQMVLKSAKVYRDRNQVLPIQKKADLKIAHFIFANQYDIVASKQLTKALKKVVQTDEFFDLGPNEYKKIAKSNKYNYIICSTGCMASYGTNQIILTGTVARNMMNGWTKYSTPVIFVDMGNPYLHEEYPAMIDSIIYTYGVGNVTIDAIIQLLFEGKIQGE